MKYNKKECGVALLYVLGILGLLMMMGLAFVSSSLFDQRAAANTARKSQANILALSMLERVTAAIQEYTAGSDYSADLKYSYSGELARDMFEALDTYNVIGGDKKSYLFNYYTSKPSVEDKEIKDNICWIPHLTKDENGNYLVIGRSAFIIKSYGRGLFNANDLSKLSLKEQDKLERRIGVKMDEVNVKYFDNAFFSFSIGSVEWADLFNQAPTANGVLPAANIAAFASSVEAKTGVASISQKSIDTINKYFAFSAAESNEAYWMDVNKDGKRDPLEWFHRFYLPGFEDVDGDGFFTALDTGRNIWEENPTDLNRVDKLLLMNPNANWRPAINLGNAATIGGQWRKIHADAKDKYGCGIPWLANFGRDDFATLKGTFTGADDEIAVRNRRQQIAANLTDYCDSDSIPTSDLLPLTWEVDPPVSPLYTGNERTPYLNEIQATIVMGAELDHSPPDINGFITVNINGKLDFTIDAEAINIYKALDATKPVAVKLKFSFNNIEVKTIIDGTTIIIPPAGITAPASTAVTLTIPPVNGYFTGKEDVLIQIPLAASQGGYISTNVPTTGKFVVKFDLTIENALLTYDGNKVDYCKINKTLVTPFEQTLDVVKDITASKTFIYSTQTEDPRQNLNSGDWSDLVGGEKPPTVTNIGLCNLSSIPKAPPGMVAGDFSVETVADPTYDGTNHMSTAHIRNAPMISPWELAFIHRGAKWETLNLKAYNDEKARTLVTFGGRNYLPGGGKYSEGDANILDQIKMTIETTSSKKLNLADINDGVLKGFLGGLCLDCEPHLDDSKPPSAPNLDGSYNANNFVDLLARGSGTVADVPDSWIEGIKNIRNSSTRAGLANAGILHQGTTEASKTEIIGKLINLVEIDKDSPMEYFDVIILSQSINDVGDNSGLAIRKLFKNATGGLTVTKNFTAKRGEIDVPVIGSPNFIADEVTGQCKLLVRGYRNPSNGKVQLISIKTVE